ncbi:FG-GAP repeat domain-containing protein [Catellatospora methionotrophica]|uniref:FG-GAP repeat domain-containing protein n=1 Tax=Catellatospora methionotrophica TaxID=121620 RepID=UPI0033F11542
MHAVAGVGDFDRDHASDVLWRKPDGRLELWFSGTAVRKGTPASTIRAPYRPRAGRWPLRRLQWRRSRDILWRQPNGQLSIWHMAGATFVSKVDTPADPYGVWQIVGAGDFDSDGRADILWRSGQGQLIIWFKGALAGSAYVTHRNTGPNPSGDWKVAGVSDLNATGNSDVIWENTASGEVVVWFMNGATYLSETVMGSGQRTGPLQALLPRLPSAI